jgi:hypothetical protein
MQPLRIEVSQTPWWLAFKDWLKGWAVPALVPSIIPFFVKKPTDRGVPPFFQLPNGSNAPAQLPQLPPFASADDAPFGAGGTKMEAVMSNIDGRSGAWLVQQNTSQQTPGEENSANAASGSQSRSVQQLSSSQPARLPSVRELFGLDSNTPLSRFDQALTQSRRLHSAVQDRKGGSIRLDAYALSQGVSQKRQSPLVQSSTDAAATGNDGANPLGLLASLATEIASGDVRPETYRQGPPYADRFDGGNAFAQTSHESPVPGGGVVCSLNSNDENRRYLTSDLSNDVDAPAFPVGGPTEIGSNRLADMSRSASDPQKTASELQNADRASGLQKIRRKRGCIGSLRFRLLIRPAEGSRSREERPCRRPR